MKITDNNIFLKFLVLLFGLWMFPFPLNYMPFFSKLSGWIYGLYQNVVLFVGNNILNLENELTVFQSGSGDKAYDYVQFSTLLAIAFFGTIIWTLIDKNKGQQKKLNYWFWVYMRYSLAAIMLSYGMSKVFPLQFPEPGFRRLITNFGEMSPMGLAWSFMGYSKGYVIFSGCLEVIGAFLLFHKRTVFLGGLILMGVTFNILALNIFYDIPVKLYAFRYLLMAVIIVSPQLKNVFRLMFGTKVIEPYVFFSPFKQKRMRIIKGSVKWLILVFYVGWTVEGRYESMHVYGFLAPKPDLYGLFEVLEFKLNGEERPPLLTDDKRWRYIVSEFEGRMAIYDMSKKPFWIQTKIDSTSNSIAINRYRDTTNVYKFTYKESDSLLILEGVFEKDSIYLKSIKYTKKDFPLMNREFHWIQEYPYNR